MLKNLLNTFATRMLSALAAFALVVLSTQHLGAEGRGYVGLMITSIANVLLLNGFIGGAALVYLLPRHKSKIYFRRLTGLAYFWILMLSAAMTAFFYFTDMAPQEQAPHIFLLGILLSAVTANGYLLVAMEQISLYNLTALLQVAVQILVFAAAVLFNDKVSPLHFIGCLYAGYGLSFLFSSAHLWRIYKRCPDMAETVSWRLLFIEVGRYGFLSQLGNVIQYLNYRMSYYVLHSQHNLADIGLYDVGIRIAEAVWMISNSISTVLYSRIANLGDNDISRRLALILAKLSMCATLAAVLVISFMPVSFFTVIFGAEFGQVRSIIRLLGPGIVIFGFTIVVSHYFAGTGRYLLNTLAALIGLLFTVAGNYFLVPRLGLAGAGWTASISYFFTGLFIIILFVKKTDYHWTDLVPTQRDFLNARDIFRNRK
jgi:O-antigen/teichoic acid export membrane protein